MATVSASSSRRFKWSKVVLSWYGVLGAYAIIVGLFLLLRGGDGNSPVALALGSLTFRWYGIIITVGVIVAAFLAQFLAERRGDDPDHVWRILPVLLIFGIIGARIWYVTFTWNNYKDHIFSFGDPVRAGAFEIWRGGIAIQGSVVGGIIGALIYGLIYNWQLKRQNQTAIPFSLWRFADFVAPGLVLAQGIGRWGNFMNNEAYGRETKWPWGIKIPCEYRTSGATPGTDDTRCSGPQTEGVFKADGPDKNALFHPTFFYESLWNYFTFLVLFYCIMKPKTIERRFKIKLRDGDVFLLYWIVYSIGRFFTEGLRTDSLYVVGGPPDGLRSAQVTAIIAILVAGFLLFYRHRKSFSVTEALSMRLAPALVGAGTGTTIAAGDVSEAARAESTSASLTDTVADAATDDDSDETKTKPDYKARVRPVAVDTVDEEEEDDDEAETAERETRVVNGLAESVPLQDMTAEAQPVVVETETSTDEKEAPAIRVKPDPAGDK